MTTFRGQGSHVYNSQKMSDARLTPTLFSKIGEALYGPSWRNALAADLGVAERTVRRWQDGASAIPDGIKTDLANLCRKHSAALAKLADQLER